MTRINLVPPQELCDQHLLAEHRELVRIPNAIVKGRAVVDLTSIPKQFVLGTGHVKFFYDKLMFLHFRYTALYAECLRRGFAVTHSFPLEACRKAQLFNNYIPTEQAIALSRARIAERMPVKARFTQHRY